MTDEEVQKHYEAMVEMFGDKLPNPIQEPYRFKYYVYMYQYQQNPVKTPESSL